MTISKPDSSARLPPLVIFALKKDKTLCLCIDFQGLNKITKKDWYPLLFISDLLTTVGKARIYTTIDLWHAYHLVCIADGDEWKTAEKIGTGLINLNPKW